MTDLSELGRLIETDRAEAGRMLDAALARHHAEGEPLRMLALHRLAERYWADDDQQVGFHRTHAYVYALEAGAWDEAEALFAALARDGRI